MYTRRDDAIGEARQRERESAANAAAASAAGPCLPLPGAHVAHRDCVGRAGGSEWRCPGHGSGRRGSFCSGAFQGQGKTGSQKQDRQSQESCEEIRSLWDKKFIHTDFAWATPNPGSRAGLWSATTTSCCSKTTSSSKSLKRSLSRRG